MKLFLDTSVLLAASGSERGASREIFRRAAACDWSLLASPYVIDEVLANLSDLPAAATADWARLRPDLALVGDILTLDRAAVFEPAKDRPILFSAVVGRRSADTRPSRFRRAARQCLLRTVDPHTMFLERERAAGRLQA